MLKEQNSYFFSYSFFITLIWNWGLAGITKHDGLHLHLADESKEYYITVICDKQGNEWFKAYLYQTGIKKELQQH